MCIRDSSNNSYEVSFERADLRNLLFRRPFLLVEVVTKLDAFLRCDFITRRFFEEVEGWLVDKSITWKLRQSIRTATSDATICKKNDPTRTAIHKITPRIQ